MLAVGTIVAIQENKYMVCGYRPYNSDDTVEIGHLLVPYPMGFMGAESISLVAPGEGFPVVHKGFRNEDAESYDGILEQLRSIGSEVSFGEYAAAAVEAASELEADFMATRGEVG